MSSDRKTIDMHVHVGSVPHMRPDIQELVQATADRRDFDFEHLFGSSDALGAYLRREGVSHAVLLADEGPGVNFYPTTEMVCDFRDAAPAEDQKFFTVFGCMNPTRYHDLVERHARDIARDVAGYKLYPADHDFHPIEEVDDAFYGRLEENHQILMFHTGHTGQSDGRDEYGDPELFRPILERHPDLRVIFAHAGKPVWCHLATDMALTYPNLYLDTAFIRSGRVLELLPRLEDISHKVLFGSDWPVGVASLSTHIAEMWELPISDEAKERIMAGNAEKLLGR